MIEWNGLHLLGFAEFELPRVVDEIDLELLSSPSIELIINGTSSTAFNPIRGFEQGDPLSPYLFILGVEFLSKLIEEEEVRNKAWDPFKSYHGFTLSHCAFTGDLLLIAKADIKNAIRIFKTLENFATILGLQVNVEKSSIIFSRNIPQTI